MRFKVTLINIRPVICHEITTVVIRAVAHAPGKSTPRVIKQLMLLLASPAQADIIQGHIILDVVKGDGFVSALAFATPITLSAVFVIAQAQNPNSAQ